MKSLVFIQGDDLIKKYKQTSDKCLFKPTLGFSIKSLVGKESTLFNPGAGTNFIYKLTKPEKLQFDVKQFNTDTLVSSKISERLKQIEKLGFEIKFHKIQSENLQLNFELIDSRLPEIFSYMVWQKYRSGISKVSKLLENLNQENPLNFDLTKRHPFYEYKVKRFLVDSALGMTPETVWTGEYDATGGIIIVKDTGDLVCYHIYNRNEFETFLLNNTKFEQASTSEDKNNPGNPRAAIGKSKPKEYKFGWVYEENGDFFIKLNLQIRFI
jgi:type II restriction enzyme